MLRHAYAPKSRGPLNTALRALARFSRECPERVLFKEPAFPGDREASAWNEWSFILLAVDLASRRSAKTKKPVKSKTIESYISLLKGYLSFSYDFEIVERSPRLKRLIASIAAGEPLGGARRKRRGFRRRHLIKLWDNVPEVRGGSADAVNEHALMATAWHVLARGGELAPQTRVWSAERHPSRADLSFHKSKDGTRYALLWLRPLKKRGKAIAQKVPQYITEYDGGGSDAYAALRRLTKLDPVAESARDTTPLFRKSSKEGSVRHISTNMLRALVQKRAASLGYADSRQWGAHSLRIGGATDLASTGEASQLLLQAKGRWASDIGKIYARMTRRSQLAASALMQKARGRDLEELLPGFTQLV